MRAKQLNPMTRKQIVRSLGGLVALLIIGSWLMGIWDWEIRIGSHVLGRRIGLDEEETWPSLLGWVLATISIGASVIILYRNRDL